jgi:hypothetical protein
MQEPVKLQAPTYEHAAATPHGVPAGNGTHAPNTLTSHSLQASATLGPAAHNTTTKSEPIAFTIRCISLPPLLATSRLIGSVPVKRRVEAV